MKAAKIALSAAMASAIALSGTVLASPGDRHSSPDGDKYEHKCPQGMDHGMDHSDRRGDMLMKKLSEKLDLTENQKTEIDAIQQAGREKAEPLRERFRDNMRAERKAFASDVSEKELKKLATVTAESRVDLMLQRKNTREKVLAVLTREQKDQLQAMKEQHRAKREERMKKWHDMKQERKQDTDS